MLDKFNFDSSNVVSATWDDQSKDLQVLFKGSRVYRYFHISYDVWSAFKDAESPGAFVNTYLKGLDCERIS